MISRKAIERIAAFPNELTANDAHKMRNIAIIARSTSSLSESEGEAEYGKSAVLPIIPFQQRIFELESENERLRAALEFYASFWNHDVQLEDIGITSMQRDRGELARKALEGSTSETAVQEGNEA